MDRNFEGSGPETTENRAIAAIDANFDADATADAEAVVEVGTQLCQHTFVQRPFCPQ